MAIIGPRKKLGPQGIPGTKWFSGYGPPDNTIMANKGDLYLDLETGDIYEFT